MSRVIGSSEEARALQENLGKVQSAIEEGVSALDGGLKAVQSSWNDEGVQDVVDMVSAIKSAVDGSASEIPGVQAAVEKYAEFLERR